MAGLPPQDTPHVTWVPMAAIALGQVIVSYNVAALPVVMGGMVESFGVPATAVATGIVAYTMVLAGVVMLGAKLVQRFATLRMFRAAIVVFGAGQALMMASPSAAVMIAAQMVCGGAAALIVPALVALIAENFEGPRQATALGVLGSARAAAGVAAFLLGGILGTWAGWRPVFAVSVFVGVAALILSFRLEPDQPRPDVKFDLFGALLAAVAIILVSLGFNQLGSWGVGMARAGAPFSVLGISPASLMILCGVLLGQGFFVWTRRRVAQGKTPLVALQVIESRGERAAVQAMFAVGALEAALNFSIPLYIQIVQGRSAFATMVATLPFKLTVLFVAVLVVRYYSRYSPRQIGRVCFALCAAALLWLAFVVRNDWREFKVMLGMVVFGIGQGALATLVFNVLVTASPKSLAGDVGSLRGVTNNLATAVGTALAGALLVALLSAAVTKQITDNPTLPPALLSQVNLDSITFVSNDRLDVVLANTTATYEQQAEAVRINTESRLLALKRALLLMAGVALLAIFPASRLPDYRPGEIPEP